MPRGSMPARRAIDGAPQSTSMIVDGPLAGGTNLVSSSGAPPKTLAIRPAPARNARPAACPRGFRGNAAPANYRRDRRKPPGDLAAPDQRAGTRSPGRRSRRGRGLASFPRCRGRARWPRRSAVPSGRTSRIRSRDLPRGTRLRQAASRAEPAIPGHSRALRPSAASCCIRRRTSRYRRCFASSPSPVGYLAGASPAAGQVFSPAPLACHPLNSSA
jgi:hypothetical protein